MKSIKYEDLLALLSREPRPTSGDSVAKQAAGLPVQSRSVSRETRAPSTHEDYFAHLEKRIKELGLSKHIVVSLGKETHVPETGNTLHPKKAILVKNLRIEIDGEKEYREFHFEPLAFDASSSVSHREQESMHNPMMSFVNNTFIFPEAKYQGTISIFLSNYAHVSFENNEFIDVTVYVVGMAIDSSYMLLRKNKFINRYVGIGGIFNSPLMVDEITHNYHGLLFRGEEVSKWKRVKEFEIEHINKELAQNLSKISSR